MHRTHRRHRSHVPTVTVTVSGGLVFITLSQTEKISCSRRDLELVLMHFELGQIGLLHIEMRL